LWVKQAGGDDYAEGQSVLRDTNGNCYVIGYIYNNATFGTIELSGSGMFIAKILNQL
jgi:hypothetical protein